jgi:hypothetical protein
MAENFVSSLGSFAKIKQSERSAFGFVSIKRDIAVAASDGSTTSKRKYLASESYTALGEIKVQIGMPLDDPRGLNVDCVGEEGMVSSELFLSLMRKYGCVKRSTLTDMSANVDSYIYEDSHIALL